MGTSEFFGTCTRNAGEADPFKNQNQCPVAPTQATKNGSNPVNTFTGSKLQVETDYKSSGPFPLQFKRYFSDGKDRDYNFVPAVFSGDMGPSWNHNYGSKIVYFTNGTLVAATVFRPEGNRYYFNQVNVNGTLVWQSIDADVTDVLTKTTDGSGNPIWRYLNQKGETEVYDVATGHLLSITNREGQQLTLVYAGPNNQLSSVSDAYGRSLQFSYNTSGLANGLLASVQAVSTAHAGQVERYEYQYVNSDRSGTRVMLGTVVFPDSTPATNTDNPRKVYKYNETVNDDPSGFFFTANTFTTDNSGDTPPYPATSNFPYYMTGIVDENGSRYATFKYRSFMFSGYTVDLARLSGHGSKVNGHYADEVTFLEYYNSFTTRDALGTQRNYGGQFLFGAVKQTSISGTTPCATCGGQNKATTYDTATGFVTSQTDFNGNVTKLKSTPSGLEACRVDGFTTVAANAPQMRKTTTLWDDALRAPTAISTWKYVSGQFLATDACDATSVTWAKVRSITNTYVNGRVSIRADTDFVSSPSVARTTSFTYNAQGLLDTVDGPRTDVTDTTTYTYDSQGNVSSIKRGNLLTTSIPLYDLSGRPLKIVDPNGAITLLTYHPRGWLTSRSIDGQPTLFGYDNVGQLTRVTLPTGAYTQYDYDDAHRLIRIKDNLNNRIEYTLDAMGNRTAEKTYDSASTLKLQLTRVYNILNQLDQQINGMGNTTRFTYDANNNVLRSIDPRDPAAANATLTPTIFSENIYDALNRVLQVNDDLSGQTVTTYDVQDHPKTVTDPQHLMTSYTVNGFGETKQLVSPDSGTISFLYDEAGNVKQKTDLRNGGVTVNYSYDALNRLKTMNYPTAFDTQFTYDENDQSQNQHGLGRLTTMLDESGTTKFYYDTRGNLTKKIITALNGLPGTPFSISYEYNGADNLTAITYPSGRFVTYHRNALGQIDTMTMTPPGGTAQPIVASATYAPFGPLTGFTLGPSNIVATYSFDLSYRPVELNYQRNGNFFPIMDARTPTHDAADNPLFQNQDDPAGNDGGTDFSYDRLSRVMLANWLESECCSSNVTYPYDANGNRLQDIFYRPGNNPSHPIYDFNYETTSNRLLSITLNPSSNGDLGLPRPSFQYDAAGNVKLITPAQTGATPLTLNYSDNNRPSQATNGTLLTTMFKHNGFGQRVAILNTSGSMVASFPSRALFYDEAGRVIAEWRANGWAYEYIYLDDRPVAFVSYPNASGGGTPAVYYYETDHLGMPRYATDSVGNGVWYTYTTEPFRNNWDAYSIYGIKPGLRFPGQYYLPETGMYYNYYRDYDPTTGRYLQPDPIGLAGGVNPYVYAYDNPLQFTDPTGLETPTVTLAGGPPPDLSDDCMMRCIAKHYDSFAAATRGAVATGALPVPKRLLRIPVVGRASEVTNPISLFGPNKKLGRQVIGTNRLAGLLGRLNLALGAGLLSYDVTSILECMQEDCDGDSCSKEK